MVTDDLSRSAVLWPHPKPESLCLRTLPGVIMDFPLLGEGSQGKTRVKEKYTCNF